MKDGPDIAQAASLIGDPARANILTALMSGKALTASELALEAGVTAQTASAHLAKLTQGHLVQARKSGRHKYFTLASEDVARLLEALMGFAAGTAQLRSRTGPRDAEMRRARVCYNHLAGEMGVHLYQSMIARGFLATDNEGLRLSDKGVQFVHDLGIAIDDLPKSRAPLCKECLDWSARQSHLAGQLGRAFLTHFIDQNWAYQVENSRVIRFHPAGEAAFFAAFETPKSPT